MNTQVMLFLNKTMVNLYWNFMTLYSYLEMRSEPYILNTIIFLKPHIDTSFIKMTRLYKYLYDNDAFNNLMEQINSYELDNDKLDIDDLLHSAQEDEDEEEKDEEDEEEDVHD